MSTKTVGELECDELLRAMDPDESVALARVISDAIRALGRQGRGAIISALVTVLLTACDPAKVDAQSEGAIELIRRAVRKQLAKSVPQ